ncbi:MAG: sialate O-acetylesterase, partial [Planctomycetota bacterium]
MKYLTCLLFALLTGHTAARAEIRTSAVFGDSMVLQRDKPIHIWGWADANASVSISLGDQSVSGKC